MALHQIIPQLKSMNTVESHTTAVAVIVVIANDSKLVTN